MFQQVADTEGTGIGLAIVRKIVQRHGGQVALSSTLGQGTTFVIRFPTTPLAPAIGRQASTPQQEATRSDPARLT